MVFMARRGGIWDEMDREFAEMERMMERMLEGMRQVDWKGRPANQPLYYGVSVDVGPDGVPHVQQFGNVRPDARGELAAGVREPYTSTLVDDKTNQIRVTAEMPGIRKEDVRVDATPDELHVVAKGADRQYEKTLRLVAPVDPDSAKARYNNGVLEVTLDLARPTKPKGKPVKVD